MAEELINLWASPMPFKQLATAVANKVDRLWADDWDMDAMIITGGGGRVL